jgi:hypothetical protein
MLQCKEIVGYPEHLYYEGGGIMKKCPKCGKINFSNVSFCSDCGENLEMVPAQNDYQPDRNLGMHWFWAWLIMQGIALAGGYLIGTIITGVLNGMNPFELLSKLSTYACIEMICRILMTYLAIFVWIRLTFKRYFHAGPWNFFTYLWNITTPLYMMVQFNNVLSQINMQINELWIITILGILVGVIGFSIYKKKLGEQL